MKIIVVGCGKVGTSIIRTLVSEGHDVTVMDTDAEAINVITNVYDVIGICGSGADSSVLQEAEVESCDLFISVTGSDEMNMLDCFIARKLGAKHTIARIRNPEYNDNSLTFLRQQLNLSMAINPELLAAQELYNILKLPSAYKVEYFSRRNLKVIELKLKPESSLVGKKLHKLREKEKINFLIGTVSRNGEVLIPDGNFELSQGDIISIIAAPHEMHKLLKSLDMLGKTTRDIMIIGGSKTAYYLAKLLSATNTKVTIIDRDEKTCRNLGELLPKAEIINGDGTDHDLLLEEGMRSVDAVLSLTGIDESNILFSVFANDLNVPKVISKVNSSALTEMARKMGLETVVSPKGVISDIIIRYARSLENSRGSGIESLYTLMNGKAEAIEFVASADSAIIGTPIKNIPIKPGMLIAGIIRERKTAIIPTGDDIIKKGDHVVVLTLAKHKLTDLSDILK